MSSRKGPLRQAVAASMALPVIFQPVMFDGRALIDGGLTNPLPFDLLLDDARHHRCHRCDRRAGARPEPHVANSI